MKPGEQTLYDFLIEIGESSLAEKFKGVVSDDPISPLKLKVVTEDILTELYSRLIRLKCPKGMLVMEFDSCSIRAQRHLQKPEHVRSLPTWLRDIESTYIDFYRKVKKG